MDEPLRHFAEWLIGQRVGGRYVIERIIRAGGMGLVAAGRHPELDQQVAIKFMRPELATNALLVARFLREARLAARVKSPHFVRVFDFGKLDTGVPYLVMEMLEGHDLRDELDARGALPVPTAIDYVLQACAGLAEVHALGIVHRDLKPSNLFLASAAGTLTVKVLDFGVSKEKATDGSTLTSTGHLVGTPLYMSPEQIRESKTADVRSDVWALGVILYELLTMGVPFGRGGETPGELYGLILHTAPVPPRDRNPHLPAGLDAVIMRCMSREPADRYATVGELADALKPFAAPASHVRVDAVHHALASVKRIESDPGDLMKLAIDHASAPTVRVLAEAKQTKSPSASGGAPSGGAAVLPPSQRLTQGEASLATHSGSTPAAPAKGRAWMIGIAAVLVGGVGLGLLAMHKEAAPAPAAIAPLPPVTMATTPTPTPNPTPTQNPPPPPPPPPAPAPAPPPDPDPDPVRVRVRDRVRVRVRERARARPVAREASRAGGRPSLEAGPLRRPGPAAGPDPRSQIG